MIWINLVLNGVLSKLNIFLLFLNHVSKSKLSIWLFLKTVGAILHHCGCNFAPAIPTLTKPLLTAILSRQAKSYCGDAESPMCNVLQLWPDLLSMQYIQIGFQNIVCFLEFFRLSMRFKTRHKYQVCSFLDFFKKN